MDMENIFYMSVKDIMVFTTFFVSLPLFYITTLVFGIWTVALKSLWDIVFHSDTLWDLGCNW